MKQGRGRLAFVLALGLAAAPGAHASDLPTPASEQQIHSGGPEPSRPEGSDPVAPRPDPEKTLRVQALSGKLVVALVALALLGPGWRRLSPARQRRAAVALIVLGAASWLHFGRFLGTRGIHYHDGLHYYVGSKYAPELGYFDLYRCIAAVEREQGRGALLDASLVRDLDDDSLGPGTWLSSPAGRCRAEFSPERWREFAHDVGFFREQMGDEGLKRLLLDHGFNATPVNAAWLRLWTSWLPATTATLRAFAWIDFAQLAGAVLAFGWAFGWRGAAALAVLLGCGGPWDYQWVGGSLLRFTWVLLLCWGLAALARRRPALGLSLLALSGLLRVFPLAFLGAAVLRLLVTVRHEQAISRRTGRALAAAAITSVVALGSGLSVGGTAVYAGFVRNVTQHAVSPATNMVGLPFVLAAQPDRGPDDLRRDDPRHPGQWWVQAHRLSIEERAPVHWAATLAALGLLVFAAWRRAPLEWCVALAGPVLFAALEMSSYDYMWLAVLVPVCRGESKLTSALLAFVAFTAGVRLWTDVLLEHVLVSCAAGALLAAFAWTAARRGLVLGPPGPLTRAGDTPTLPA